MKKYKVRVEQVKEYEIEIDDSKISMNDLKDFESYMYKLDKIEGDKYGSLAYHVARNQANELDFEGIGFPLIKGKSFVKPVENENINISMLDEEYEDIEVEELK